MKALGWTQDVGDWAGILEQEATQGYLEALESFVRAEDQAGRVFPPAQARLRALVATPLSRVRAVLLGQDPYPGDGQAMGLAFSVPQGVAVPRSLRNIYKEIERDMGVDMPRHGDLSGWARQGVLLLNTTLSVREGVPASHARRGWERLTDAIIRAVSEHREGVVFLLWGRHAQSKSPLVDPHRHLVLETSHPSPLGARHGFMGCSHFSRTNAYLESRGQEPIDWAAL